MYLILQWYLTFHSLNRFTIIHRLYCMRMLLNYNLREDFVCSFRIKLRRKIEQKCQSRWLFLWKCHSAATQICWGLFDY